MTMERFTADKATVRAELERRARAHRTITYGEAAAMIGWSARGLGRLLDAIKADEARRGRPDLGAFIVMVSTGLPSYAEADPVKRARAIAAQEAVFSAWSAMG